MEPTVAGTALAAQVTSHLSPVGIFLQADPIVKLVLVGLALASLWSWSIIFDKAIRLRSLFKQAELFEEKFWSGISLEDLFERIGARPKPRRQILRFRANASQQTVANVRHAGVNLETGTIT